MKSLCNYITIWHLFKVTATVAAAAAAAAAAK